MLPLTSGWLSLNMIGRYWEWLISISWSCWRGSSDDDEGSVSMLTWYTQSAIVARSCMVSLLVYLYLKSMDREIIHSYPALNHHKTFVSPFILMEEWKVINCNRFHMMLYLTIGHNVFLTFFNSTLNFFNLLENREPF